MVSTSEAIKRKAEAGSDDDDEDDDGDDDDDSEAEEEEVKAKAIKAPPKEGMAGGTPRKTAKVPPTLGGWTLDNGNKGKPFYLPQLWASDSDLSSEAW